MPEDLVHDHSNELNDASKDRDIASNNERDQVTTDFSQDVDTQERLRSNAVSYDLAKQQAELENQRRDRSANDESVAQGRRAIEASLQLQQQLNNAYATHVMNSLANMNQQTQNMINASEALKNQDRRHVDHTVIDLHGSDVNPGASPNVK